jgi:hypothetical protein
MTEFFNRIAHALNDSIKKTYVPLLSDVVFEGDVVPPPSRIPWCAMLPMCLQCVWADAVLNQVSRGPRLAVQCVQESLEETTSFQKISLFPCTRD